jgi:hypothetical protein
MMSVVAPHRIPAPSAIRSPARLGRRLQQRDASEGDGSRPSGRASAPRLRQEARADGNDERRV